LGREKDLAIENGGVTGGKFKSPGKSPSWRFSNDRSGKEAGRGTVECFERKPWETRGKGNHKTWKFMSMSTREKPGKNRP